MSHGFVCRANNGLVQLDSVHPSLCMIRKQVFNCPRVQNGGVINDVPFPTRVHASTKMIAARANFWVRIGGQTYPTGEGNASVQLPFYNTPSGTITVWEFGDLPTNYWKQKMGLVVRNPNTQQVVYSSNWATANILYFNRVNVNQGWSMTLPNNGNNCAVVIGGGGSYRSDSDEYVEFNSLFWRISGATLQIQSFTDRYSRPNIWGGPNPSKFTMPLFIMVIDITGL